MTREQRSNAEQLRSASSEGSALPGAKGTASDRGPERSNLPGAPRLYGELADWFHLLTAPDEYADEAAVYYQHFVEAAGAAPRTLLELGSGGGNNASHLKQWVACTLVDRSDAMLAISRRLNPECEHLQGDMRSVRLDRTFDAVFVHDAVSYLTTEGDLRQAMETAFVHCRPGGVAIFAPDDLRETFKPRTECGGRDGPGRALRYLEWAYDPDPADTSYLVDFAYLLREDTRPLRLEHDRHECGLFPRDLWLLLLAEVGFRATIRPLDLPDDTTGLEMFVAIRPDER